MSLITKVYDMSEMACVDAQLSPQINGVAYPDVNKSLFPLDDQDETHKPGSRKFRPHEGAVGIRYELTDLIASCITAFMCTTSSSSRNVFITYAEKLTKMTGH
jgi:hypothetical protein